MPSIPSPTLVTTGSEIRRLVVEAQQAGQRVGVVPTMGALHAGHVSLVDAARVECDWVVVTVFVNPTQFGPGEDFESYPRDLQKDADQLRSHGCDYFFAPSQEEIYPDGYETTVDVGSVARPLEGERRPTHFAGVATVVLKLLQLVPADVAYFGQKDYQQTLVVRRMVADLNVSTKVQVCPTVREDDGLAMSSRNAYLSAADRQRAASLHAALQLAKTQISQGEQQVATLVQAMRALIADVAGESIAIDYLAFVREGTVEEVTTVTGPTVALVAAHVGTARLIDNLKVC